ncbi:MAG TPA: glycoside hydrolase family 3 N-terminal domain-containing protein [Spongiibacteraceae bacterium]|nr:glycoside hydrolase family 3 N-terminal domain-containing protein [Spongiibacteraceae bacterium]
MLRTKAKLTPTETERERENRRVAYRAASESIVLLKNDGALPIKPGRIALYGAGAKMTIKGGTGSGEVNERYSVSILEGLENAGYSIGSRKWIDDYSREYQCGEAEYAAMVAKKFLRLDFAALANIMANPYCYPYGREITDADIRDSDTDTVIYVIARQAGEGGDRKLDNGDYSLSEIEKSNIRKCAQAYKNTIVVINVGSSFDIGFMDEIAGIDALIFFCQQGCEGGNAFADIVSGRVSPSGKLTDTWAKKYSDIPYANEYSYLNGDLNNEYYREGIYVGYRYFDTFQVDPYYEFGYGLSYTDFAIDFVDLVVNGEIATLTVRVKNCGEQYAGKEVVQVYVSCPQARSPKEYQRLAAFAKTDLLAIGETQEMVIDIDMRLLASYDEASASFILDQGDYIVRVGNSSRNTRPVAVLTLARLAVISWHSNICPQHSLVDELQSPPLVYRDDLASVPKFELKAADFNIVVHKYEAPSVYSDEKVGRWLEQLTTRDMVDLVVGVGLKGMLFSNNYFTVPGAVGNTTSKLVGKGIINVALADGPAGLRLLRTSAATKKGTVKMIDAMIDVMNYMPRLIKKWIFGNPKKDTLLYQFTTAFPVELALAQTWNTELLEEVGRAVSREMTEYGVTFWLAPAMNIHRNPLCGRNFEYYSEDPLLTGKLAAAVTRGCQSSDGNYATIKHFCANNQEDNRFKVSSNISERALREIYLRGFEIAVREGKAKAVMSAYNKVNGVYASNSHDLCTKVLRNEWGFDGVVMTDWMATGKDFANNGLCMRAGNDLIMPGGRYFKKQLLAGLKEGIFSDEDLRRCAANVLRSIAHSRVAAEYPLNPSAR